MDFAMRTGPEQSDVVETCCRPAATSPNPNFFFRTPIVLKNYKLYNDRISSYTHWKYSHIITPEMLARGGFYYKADSYEKTLTERDNVECAWCGLRLTKWEPFDNPIEEHYKRNRACMFIQYICPV